MNRALKNNRTWDRQFFHFQGNNRYLLKRPQTHKRKKLPVPRYIFHVAHSSSISKLKAQLSKFESGPTTYRSASRLTNSYVCSNYIVPIWRGCSPHESLAICITRFIRFLNILCKNCWHHLLPLNKGHDGPERGEGPERLAIQYNMPTLWRGRIPFSNDIRCVNTLSASMFGFGACTEADQIALLSTAGRHTFDTKERVPEYTLVSTTRMEEKPWSTDGLGLLAPPGRYTPRPEPKCIMKGEVLHAKGSRKGTDYEQRDENMWDPGHQRGWAVCVHGRW